jgi:hypothetical protein
MRLWDVRRRWSAVRLAWLVCFGLFAPQTSLAQGLGQAVVPFASPGTGDGYPTAQTTVAFRYIVCDGEIHIAYSLNPGAVTAGQSYRLAGKAYPAAGAPPQPSTIRFAGTVYSGGKVIGSFGDGLAAQALGMGCFSGQTRKIAKVSDHFAKPPTEAEIASLFNTFRLVVEPAEVLRNGTIESSIRGEQRRQEAAAAETKRKTEQAAADKASEEAEHKVAAERQRQAAQAPAQASTQPSTPSRPAPAMTPAQLQSQAAQQQQAAEAARLKELYAQGDRARAELDARRQREYQANLDAAQAERDRQAAMDGAMVAAAPAIYGAIESVTDAIDQMIEQPKIDNYRRVQEAMKGKCYDANGIPFPKDGEVQLGVTLKSQLTSNDCGPNYEVRLKAYRLVVPQPATLHIRVTGSMWMNADFILWKGDTKIFQIDARATGIIMIPTDETVKVTGGEYKLIVYNAVGSALNKGFTLRVDAVDAQGRVIASAAPVTPAPVAPAQAQARGPATAMQATAPALSGAAASLSVLAPGEHIAGALEASDPLLSVDRRGKQWPVRCYAVPTEAGAAYELRLRKGTGSTNPNVFSIGPFYALGTGDCRNFTPLLNGYVAPTALTVSRFTSGGGAYVLRVWSTLPDFHGDTFDVSLTRAAPGPGYTQLAAGAPAQPTVAPVAAVAPAAPAKADGPPEVAAAYNKLCAPSTRTLSEATCQTMKRDMEQRQVSSVAAELNATYDRFCTGPAPQFSAAACVGIKADMAASTGPAVLKAVRKTSAKKK